MRTHTMQYIDVWVYMCMERMKTREQERTYHCLYRSSNCAFHPSGTRGGGGPGGGANDMDG